MNKYSDKFLYLGRRAKGGNKNVLYLILFSEFEELRTLLWLLEKSAWRFPRTIIIHHVHFTNNRPRCLKKKMK